jgi:hypothetical protein
MRALAGIAVLLMLSFPGAAGAQAPPASAGAPPMFGAAARLVADAPPLFATAAPPLVAAAPRNAVTAAEARMHVALQSAGRSRWREGALVGLIVGAAATYAVLHSGGSTSLCDRSANQDAIRAPECAGLVAAGGVVGAGIGALIGGRFR